MSPPDDVPPPAPPAPSDEAPALSESEGPHRSLPIAGQTRGRSSVARALDHWYVLATSEELPAKGPPLARMLYGTPIVLYRDATGVASAMLDRCPHRNVPLSLGRVTDQGHLECGYHGWRFDRTGACLQVPSLCEASRETDAPARRATVFPTLERDGFVWVYGRAGGTAHELPFAFPHLDAPGYTHVYQVTEAEGTLLATAENALDVPHTAFLHRGLFRSESRGITIEAVVRRAGDRVEAEYVGEPRPPGIVGTLMSPTGGVVEHFDRFIAPSITQVEYRLGRENHVVVSSALTPVDDFRTKLFTIVSFKLRVPGPLVSLGLKPIGLRIFGQDATMLRAQTETVKRFGGEQFASTEIDVLGKHIWRLLRACERGPVARGETLAEVSRTALVL